MHGTSLKCSFNTRPSYITKIGRQQLHIKELLFTAIRVVLLFITGCYTNGFFARKLINTCLKTINTTCYNTALKTN